LPTVESPTILLTSLYFYFAVVGLGGALHELNSVDP
jgi:hypothetical protein